jgi:hypothetical protein
MSSSTRVTVSVDPPTDLKGKALVIERLDPEIKDFEEYFSQKKVGGTLLMPIEREILRAYLYWKVAGGVQ